MERKIKAILGENIFIQDYDYGKLLRVSSTDMTITPLQVAECLAAFPGSEAEYRDDGVIIYIPTATE